MTAAQTITANFAIDTFALNFASGGNGTLTGTTSQTINYDGNATAVTAVPSTGYHFVNWTGTGGFATTTSNPLTVTNVTAAQTITANFAIDAFTVTPSAGSGGTLSPNTAQTVNYNGTSTFTVTPNTGYHVSSVTGCPGTLSGSSYTTGAIIANCTVTASFAIDTFTVTPFAGSGGTISPNTAQTVNYNGTTSFTVTPTTGYYVSDVKVDGVSVGAVTSYVFTKISADHTIDAAFAINTYTLVYTAGANGSVTGTTSQTVNHGSNGSAVTAVPVANYHFVNWSDGSTANPRTDTNVTANITVTANFAITDSTPPDTNITGKPANQTNSTTGSFTFDSTEAGSSFECKLDGGAWTGCTNPMDYTGLAAGIHTFNVRATDAALNTDQTPASYTWSIDQTTPEFTSVSPLSNAFVNTATIGYTLDKDVASGTVAITWTGGTTDPSSPYTYNFATSDMTSGSHTVNTGFALVNEAVYTVSFDATDAAGNAATTVSNTNITFDAASASAAITSPASGSKVNNANVGYTLSEAISSGNIVITRTGGNADVGSPHTYTLAGTELTSGTHSVTTGMPLIDGAVYTISIENVFDPAENATSAVANTSITYDSTSVAITNMTPAASSAIATATVSYTLSEQATSGTVTFTRTGGSADAGSPYLYTLTGADLSFGDHTVDTGLGLVDGAIYTVSFDSTDMAGNAATTVSNAMVLFDNTHDITATITGIGTFIPSGATGVSHGETRTFTATPAPGYYIASITGCGGNLTGSTFTTGAITADCTVTPNFAINSYAITTSAGANGVIDATTTVNYGGNLTVNVAPNAGYYVADVLVDGSSVGAVTSYAFINVAANHTINVSFAINTFTVTPSAGTDGTISPNTPQTVNYNGTTSFTVTPNTGYQVTSVTGCNGTLSGNTYTIGAISAGCSVTASFASDDITPPAFSSASPALNSFINTATVGYTLSEAALSGKVTFTRTGGTADSATHVYNFTASDRTVGTHTVNTGLPLVNGAIYTVTFDATDTASNNATQVSSTSVTFDTASTSITINTPASGSLVNNTTVTYALSENISGGDIVFTRTGGNADSGSPRRHTLSGGELTSGSHTVDTGLVLVSGAVYSIGFENITDKAGNATANVANTNVTYDSMAVAITGTSPAPNAVLSTHQASYTLSEAAQAGKVTFTRIGGTPDPNPHVYALTSSDLYAGPHTLDTDLTLVEGAFYSVSFEATDMVGNPATAVSNAGVFYDSNYGVLPIGNVDNTSSSLKRVDGDDLIKLSFSFGSGPGDANWNPVCDIDKSGRVDGGDLIALGIHFGEVAQ